MFIRSLDEKEPETEELENSGVTGLSKILPASAVGQVCVLFGSSTAHKAIRKELVENRQLRTVISMPSGVFKPYAGVSTAMPVFTKTGAGGTDKVWFYDMKADGFSLDDKRSEIKENDIPDIVARFHSLTLPQSAAPTAPSKREPAKASLSEGGGTRSVTEGVYDEAARDRTEQSFLMPKDEIAANDYDLSMLQAIEDFFEI